jgi:hypothetical protein
VRVAEYAFIVPVEVESFDWGAQGDEWIHRVSECMEEIEGFLVTGHKYDDTTKPFIEFAGTGRDGAPLDTRLVVIPGGPGIFIAVAGRADEPDEVAAEAWAQAARCATSRLGASSYDFQWAAFIAPPAVRITGAEPAIHGQTTFDIFRLSSAEQPLEERMPPQTPSFSVAGSGISWPILVEAHHDGYSWPAAMEKAAFDLHRLCGLLSLALAECLVVRDGPTPASDGLRTVPHRLWWHNWLDDLDASEVPEPRNVKVIPDWVAGAWKRMKERPRLAHAVAIHHEGLRAQSEHPSLALVAFIASVEAISNLLFKEERCPECKNHKHVADRFRATLRFAVTDEEAELLGSAYSPRSYTVHQGRLHGAETSPGAFRFRWGSDPIRQFDYMVWGMRAASRKLLQRAVSGELPTSRVAFNRSLHLPYERDSPT